MKVLVTQVNLFAAAHPILLVDTETGEKKVMAQALAPQFITPTIAHVANEHNIDNIHIFGNETYVNKMAEDLNVMAKTRYGKSFKIEVN